MIFWAVLGFGLFLLLVAFGIPRTAFAITLVVLMSKQGWFDYFGPGGPGGLADFGATLLTIIFVGVAVIGGLILDIDYNTLR